MEIAVSYQAAKGADSFDPCIDYFWFFIEYKKDKGLKDW